jgi:transcription elongation GreA/GreB family factor
MSAPAAESVKRANEDPENDRADEAQAKRQATALSMLSSAALDEDASEELAANEGARNIFEEQLRQLQALQQEHAEGGKVHVSDSDDDDEEKEGTSNKVKNKWLLPPKQQRGPRVGDEYQANLT